MKKIFLNILVIGIIMGMVSFPLFASGSTEGGTVKLKLAENQPDNNPVTIAMFKFAELVKEKSNGSVEIEVYSNAQLGQEVETIEQVHAGILDMARVNTVPLVELDSNVGVLTLPYIFANQDHKFKVLDGEIGQEIRKSLEDYDIVGLDFLEAGTRNFYTTDKPIKSLQDLKGLKIRVQQSEVVINMMKLLGAVPTPMNYGEVFTSLQTGVIDGAENDFVSYYTSGHYEAAKHYSLDGHLSPPAIVIVSKKTWDALSTEQQNAIKEASSEAAIFERKAMNDKQNEFRKLVEDAGTTVYSIEDISAFQDAIAPIYTNYPEYESVIKRIRALQ